MKIFIRPDFTLTGEKEATPKELHEFLRKLTSRVFIVTEKKDKLYFLLETKVGNLLIARIEL